MTLTVHRQKDRALTCVSPHAARRLAGATPPPDRSRPTDFMSVTTAAAECRDHICQKTRTTLPAWTAYPSGVVLYAGIVSYTTAAAAAAAAHAAAAAAARHLPRASPRVSLLISLHAAASASGRAYRAEGTAGVVASRLRALSSSGLKQ